MLKWKITPTCLFHCKFSCRLLRYIVCLLIGIVIPTVICIIHRFHVKEPYHTSIFSGEGWVQELLHGHTNCIQCELGVHKHVFHALVQMVGLGSQKLVFPLSLPPAWCVPSPVMHQSANTALGFFLEIPFAIATTLILGFHSWRPVIIFTTHVSYLRGVLDTNTCAIVVL